MDRIQPESFGLVCPAFADVLLGCEAFESLEELGVIVGVDEVAEMGFELRMAVVMIAFDDGFLDRPVHPFDLAVGPGMPDLGEPVLDAILTTTHIEHVRDVAGGGAIGVAWREGKLDAVVGQHGVGLVGYGFDQGDQEGGGGSSAGLLHQLDEGELAGSVHGHEQVEFSFGRADLGDVDMEVADGIGLELAFRFLVAGHLREPADPVALQAPVQRGSRQVRDRGL